MKRAELAVALERAVAPFVERLKNDLVKVAVAELGARLENARTYAIERLRADLEGKTDGAKLDAGPTDSDRDRAALPRRTPDRRSAVDRDAGAGDDQRDRRRDPEGTHPSSPSTAAVKQLRLCRACRQPGHRSDRCPNGDRDIKPANVISASPPPLGANRTDRFARIEAAARTRRGFA